MDCIMPTFDICQCVSLHRDPNLWVVKCLMGQEKETALLLMRKFIAYQFTDEVSKVMPASVNVSPWNCFSVEMPANIGVTLNTFCWD